jgi:hypothetical protein
VGKNRSRLLFNSIIHHYSQALHPISLLPEHNVNYTIHNVGGVTGKTPIDSEFEAFDESADPAVAEPLFHLKVICVNAVSCIARVLENLNGMEPPPRAIARLTNSGALLGSLRVYFDHAEDPLPAHFDEACRKLQSVDSAERWMVSSSKQEEAQIGVYLEANGSVLAFKILDEKISRLGSTRVAFTVPATVNHLLHVLRAASRFFYHLRHTPHKHQLRDKIAMHVHELVETDDLDDDFIPILQPNPKKSDIIPAIDTVDEPKPWTVVADAGEIYYGIELTQKSTMKFGLFASMLFFNCHTLEIREHPRVMEANISTDRYIRIRVWRVGRAVRCYPQTTSSSTPTSSAQLRPWWRRTASLHLKTRAGSRHRVR